MSYETINIFILFISLHLLVIGGVMIGLVIALLAKKKSEQDKN